MKPVSRSQDLAKRSFDLAASAIGLSVLSPVLGLAAVCIRLDSPGPVFFRQVRVGRGGTPFRIWKFRTMAAVQADGAPQVTTAGDARITRVGTWLRRFKLDELPQLINVVVGEMSLVGPRPEVPRYVALYPPGIRDLVLSVRPGITDLASITFRDENEMLAKYADPERAYIDAVMPKKLKLYAQYIESQSFWGDIALILRTLRSITARDSRDSSG